MIDEIAKRTGFSKVTVKQVLGNRAHLYRAETRDRVRKVAEELGYRPNAAARATRTGSFGAYGLLLSTEYGRARLTEPLFHDLREAMREQSLHLVVGDLPDEHLSSTDKLPRILREWSVDGLIVNYTHEAPRRMRSLIEAGLPAVWLNTRMGRNCIHPDDLAAGYTATRLLLDRGHRRVVYLTDTNPVHHYSYRDRRAGYDKAMAQAGLAPEHVGYRAADDPEQPLTLERLTAMLDGPRRPTAVVAYGLGVAQEVVLVAAMRGLRVPADLSVVVFNHEPARLGSLRLSTLRLDTRTMATLAVSKLGERVAKKRDSHAATAVAFIPESLEASVAAPPA